MSATVVGDAAPRLRPTLRFSKMHGAGNDFVILDRRAGQALPDAPTARQLADRHLGVGCDQLIAITDPLAPGSIAAYRIWNTDGSVAEQCGNGARCVAAWLRRDARWGANDASAEPAPDPLRTSANAAHSAALANAFILDSPAGAIEVTMHSDEDVELAMAIPDFTPARIPLMMDTGQQLYELVVDGDTLRFGAASMGNPHALIEVADIAAAPVARIGAALQASSAFPDGVNVGFAQVLAADRIALRVYERGVGETLACGSGACAAVAILVRQGRLDRNATVMLPGGTLHIDWPRDDAAVRLRGAAAFVFEGEWNP